MADAVGELFVKIKPDLEEFGTQLNRGMTAVGVGAGIALAKGVSDAFEAEGVGASIAAQLGLEAASAEAGKYGEIAGNLYRNAWGESIAEVGAAVTATVSSLDGLNDAQIEDVTEKALALADAFQLDAAEAVGMVSTLLGSGIVSSAEEGLDVITSALQQVPAALRGEIVDAGNEYSQFFRSLGLSAEEGFGLLVAGAQDGQYGIDKTGDALKEFTIRATDMSSASTKAFESIGLDAVAMTNSILAGGDSARGAFQQIVDGLLGIEDPAAQSAAAIALFGTPIEDLGVADIPEFLQGLKVMDTSLGDVEGAAQDVADTLGGTTAAKFETFKRQALGELADFASDSVIPALEGLLPVLTGLFEIINVIPGPAKSAALGIAALGIAVAKLSGPIGAAIKAVRAFTLLLAANPYILLIGATIALGVLIFKNWDTIKRVVGDALEWVADKLEVVLNFILTLWTTVWNTIVSVFTTVWETIKSVVSTALSFIQSVISTYINVYVTIFQTAWNTITAVFQTASDIISGIVGTIMSVIGGIGDVITGVRDIIGNAWDWIVEKIRWAKDQIVTLAGDIASAADRALGPIDEIVGGVGGLIGKGLNILGFDEGGVVPGPRGAPRLVLAHGGETILPTHKQSAGAMVPMTSSVAREELHLHIDGPIIIRDDRDIIETGRMLGREAAREKRAQGVGGRGGGR